MTAPGYFDFGGGDSDVTVDLLGNAIANVELTVWTAIVGGSQVTDLLRPDNTVISDGKVRSHNGAAPNTFEKGRFAFQAPDIYTTLYLDRGYGERWVVWARQAVQDLGTLASAVASAVATADAAEAAVASKMDEADADLKYTQFNGGAVTTGQWEFDTVPTVGGVPLGTGGGPGGPHAITHAFPGGSDPLDPTTIGAMTEAEADLRYIRTVDGSNPDASGNVSTANNRARTAAAILAAADADPQDMYQTLSTPPTITISAAGASPSITNGIRVAPKMMPGSGLGRQIDTENDPHFEYIGTRPYQIINTSVKYAYANIMTGGTATSKRDVWRVRFWYTGAVFEAHYRCRTTAVQWRLWVDGVPMTSDPVLLQTGTAGSNYYYKVTFADARPRVITIDMYDPEFGGIVIEPTAQIGRQRVPRRTIQCFGDSITDGSTGVLRNNGWHQWCARMLNMDWINTAIGATGYLTETSPGSMFRDRLEDDVLTQVTDVFVMFGGYNDQSSFAPGDIATEAGRCLDILLEGMPTTVIILAGMWFHSGSPTTTALTINSALRAEAEMRGVPFIDLLDPSHQVPDTPAWVASQTYYEGDEVVRNGIVYKSLLQHSNVTFTASQWYQTTFIRGSGNVGAPTGLGNADVFIAADGVHPTLDGHKALARFMYDGIVNALRQIAGAR